MRRYTVVPRAEVGDDRWDDVVDRSPYGWLWQRAAVQAALATWPARTDAGFALVDPSGDVAAVVPVHLVRRTVAGITLTRLDSHGGPAPAELTGTRTRRLLDEAIRDAVVALARRHRALHATLSLPPLARGLRPPDGARVNPLAAAGCHDLTATTWIIDLKPGHDVVWRGVQERTRLQIRAAEREGVVVREGGGDADVERYYALHLQTYRRSGHTPHPKAYFEAIDRNVRADGRARLLFAERDGIPLAAGYFARDGEATSYWTGASSDAGREHRAGDVLQWHAIRHAIDDGHLLFESGEAHLRGGEKHLAISRFKQKFGGALEPMFRGRLYTGPRLVNAALKVLDARPFERDP